jgi:hypothetical protein
VDGSLYGTWFAVERLSYKVLISIQPWVVYIDPKNPPHCGIELAQPKTFGE